MQDAKEINICEVCGNENLVQVINLGKHPMCDDLIPLKHEDKFQCAEYPIEILFCDKCFTAHQRYQIKKNILFPISYHYRSRFTKDVLKGMKDLVKDVVSNINNIERIKVLDIGCNDGSLLNFFKDAGANKTFGVEPTSAADDVNQAHIVINDYFSPKVAGQIREKHGLMDIITFTNVFAHIDDLNELISSLKTILSENGILIIENHYLGSVLDKNQFDTFYHEHPRTYSLKSFSFIADKLKRKIKHYSFPKRYGGNIRVVIGNDTFKSDNNEYFLDESKFKIKFDNMNQNIINWKKNKKNIIMDIYEKYGPIPAKAFPGRAAILVKLLGLNEKIISAVFEQDSSPKVSHFVPGTRIPIKKDLDLFSRNMDLPILNLAWHIPNEIKNYLKKNGYSGEIINIINDNDFI
jgi:SAM-dependent methyltransferase